MKHMAMGIDEQQRKLLIVQKMDDGKYDYKIICIDLVTVHFIKNSYNKINANNLKKGFLEEYLEKISLCIEFSDGKQPFEITFYDHMEHNIFELPELTQLARDWNVIIYKVQLRQSNHKITFSNYKSQYWQGY